MSEKTETQVLDQVIQYMKTTLYMEEFLEKQNRDIKH